MWINDNDFLIQLFTYPEREIYARITALTAQEKYLEFIEGKVTGGSINVDGNSAVRRTCSLTMVAQDVNINEYYWGLRNKFKLEIGLKNRINNKYPSIIWFKQGTFVITSFNASLATNNYTINISGKDKMCLLNGDIAGHLPHTTDFGVEEYFDGNMTTYYNIPIKTIIREMMQNFGNELVQNIVINDIEDAGLDLLEYRGDIDLYLLKNQSTGIFDNMTINPNQPCIINGIDNNFSFKNIQNFDSLTSLQGTNPNIDIIKFSPEGIEYSVAKIAYGNIAGYRLTELIYAGDLIANVGETITSVLDKIKNMLGDFEYFYDLDGRFVFQKKRTFVNTNWNSLVKDNDGQYYATAAMNSSSNTFNFTNSILITAFQNNPNLLNLRNDFTVWGKRKSLSGAELDIHMRYAIDKKPEQYVSLNGTIYNSKNYDWRELIYQMALDYRAHYHDDDFLLNVFEKNPNFINGKTGYEQYYIDLEGFWRLLYNPAADADENIYYKTGKNKYWCKDVFENPENLIFWFDFLDAEYSDLYKYSVPMVGSRTKVINDNDVKKIYYRDIPTVIFTTERDIYFDAEPGYTKVQLQNTMENLFTISSKGKSCKERIDELLYEHSYCIESINLSALPVYSLEPNTRIYVKDDKSKINGEYIINKLTFPLTYNGTMSITAIKAVTNIN